MFREARRHAGNLGAHPKALFPRDPLAPPTTRIHKTLPREARAREEETRKETQTRGRARRDPGWALARIKELLRELDERTQPLREGEEKQPPGAGHPPSGTTPKSAEKPARSPSGSRSEARHSANPPWTRETTPGNSPTKPTTPHFEKLCFKY